MKDTKRTLSESIIWRFHNNIHDLGDLGEFIRVEYAENIVKELCQESPVSEEQPTGDILAQKTKEFVDDYSRKSREDMCGVQSSPKQDEEIALLEFGLPRTQSLWGQIIESKLNECISAINKLQSKGE